jgi:hypothetical protein
VVGEPQAELLVGLGHLGGLGVAQVPGDVRAFFDQGPDLLAGDGPSLSVAPPTAKAHVENIRRKVQVRSRAQIVAR